MCALRTAARYVGPLEFARFLPRNAGYTEPTPTSLLGGAGPFDFSSAAVPAAVTIIIKTDAATAVSDTVDLSAAGDISAVTATELFGAINTAVVTNLTASLDADLRVKLVLTAPGSAVYFQVYGEVGLLAGFGQGYGVKWIKTNTLQSAAITVNRKDTETLSVTDSNGIDIEILRDGYRKGQGIVLTETARDPNLIAMVSGVAYTAADTETSTSEDTATRFMLELFYPLYQNGTSDIADKVGYVQEIIRYCVATVDEPTKENAIGLYTYNITATQPKDLSGNLLADSHAKELTVAAFNLLDVENA